MNNLEVVNTVLSAIEKGDIKRASQFIDDSMQFVGPTPVPLGKNEFLGLHEALVAGLPDWRFNQKLQETSPGHLEGQVQVSGTFTEPLSLPMLGLKNVSPTKKSGKNPVEGLTVDVRNGKIVRLEARVPADGGVVGMLTRVGVKVPAGASH